MFRIIRTKTYDRLLEDIAILKRRLNSATNDRNSLRSEFNLKTEEVNGYIRERNELKQQLMDARKMSDAGEDTVVRLDVENRELRAERDRLQEQWRRADIADAVVISRDLVEELGMSNANIEETLRMVQKIDKQHSWLTDGAESLDYAIKWIGQYLEDLTGMCWAPVGLKLEVYKQKGNRFSYRITDKDDRTVFNGVGRWDTEAEAQDAMSRMFHDPKAIW